MTAKASPLEPVISHVWLPKWSESMRIIASNPIFKGEWFPNFGTSTKCIYIYIQYVGYLSIDMSSRCLSVYLCSHVSNLCFLWLLPKKTKMFLMNPTLLAPNSSIHQFFSLCSMPKMARSQRNGSAPGPFVRCLLASFPNAQYMIYLPTFGSFLW